MSRAATRNRNRRIRAQVRLWIGIMRDFWKESRIARRQGMAVARERMSARHRRRAIQFRDTALDLGGVIIKLGQFFSTRVDVMPPEYIEELAKLQDTVPPVSFEEVEAVISDEFEKPLAEVFLEFDIEPIAAASLAQVHLARLPDGRRVAVKVQRPGIDKLADIDLAIFGYLMEGVHRFTSFGRRVDIPMIVSEIVRTAGDELDFVREGSHADRFRSIFADNEQVHIPEVYWSHTTTKVLTLEAVGGIKISDYEAITEAGIDRAEVAQLVIDSYLKQVLEAGFFHADPHPGNIFVGPGPVLTFVDFGMVGEITTAMKEAIRDGIIGIAQRDSGQVVEALRELKFIRPGADTRSVKNAIDWTVENYSDLRSNMLTFDRVEEIHDDILRIIRDQPLTVPANFTYLGKTLGATVGVTTGLDPNIDLIEATKPYVAKLTSLAGGDMLRFITDEAKSLAQMLLAIPKQIHDTLENIQTGRIRIKVDSSEIVNAIDQSGRHRLTWSYAVFSGLVVIGGVWLVTSDLIYEGYIFVGLGFLSFVFGTSD